MASEETPGPEEVAKSAASTVQSPDDVRDNVQTQATGNPSVYLPGTLLTKRYRIVGPIGRGGMGEVYRAEDLRLGQTVALKFLPEALERNPSAVERLFGEVRIARQISHPNVCRGL